MASVIKVDTIQSTTSNVFIQNSSGTEYARFDSSGNMLVGTGTNGSASKLLVAGGNFAVGTNGSTPEFQVAYDGTNAYLDARLASGGLIFRTGSSTERMRITSAGNVGIGTTNPLAKLNVVDGTYNCNMYIGYSGGGGTNYLQTNVATYFTNSTGVTFHATVNPYGIGLGTATPTSGFGIAFPATQSASSDANTLDDYEEGTWTPTITSSSGTITSYTSTGYYVKIGKQVTVWCNVKITNVGTGTGSVSIASMPFTVNATDLFGIVAVGRETDITGSVWQGWTTSGGNGFNLLRYDNAGLIGTNYRYVGSVTYTV